MEEVIVAEQLSKTFILKEHPPGILGALQGVLLSKTKTIAAVNSISFKIKAGERVAFIGPNGAGKSTTIKILTGILYPSSGQTKVLGLTPSLDRQKLGYKIGTVFGQRTQLWYHLPPIDTFELLAKIYEIDSQIYKKRLHDLVEIFELSKLLHKPVSQLSLGERMRCETVASLLHNPQILFLDEPTIGLDINAKLVMRGLLNHLSREYGTTLFLTSHDTADIEQVCERVIILDRGNLIMNSSIKELRKTYSKKKILSFLTDKESLSLDAAGIKVIEDRDYHFVCEVDVDRISVDKVIEAVGHKAALKDVTVENPSMEEIIRTIYGSTSHA